MKKDARSSKMRIRIFLKQKIGDSFVSIFYRLMYLLGQNSFDLDRHLSNE
jgi:hypothetical protein